MSLLLSSFCPCPLSSSFPLVLCLSVLSNCCSPALFRHIYIAASTRYRTIDLYADLPVCPYFSCSVQCPEALFSLFSSYHRAGEEPSTQALWSP
jgi:hypothetical protein